MVSSGLVQPMEHFFQQRIVWTNTSETEVFAIPRPKPTNVGCDDASFSALHRNYFLRNLLRNLLLVLFLHVSCFVSTSFANKIDSLHNLLRTASDTARVRVLNALCWEYRNKDELRSFDYSTQAYKLAKELGFMQAMAENRNFTGIVYRNIGDYPKAMACFTEAREIAERNTLTIELAFAMTNIGEVYRYEKNYSQALSYVYRGYVMFHSIKHIQGQYFANIRLGEIYQGEKRLDSALLAYQRALRICEETNDGYRAAGSLRRIGAVYRAQGNFSAAVNSYKQALLFADQARDNDEGSATMIDLGSLLASVGKYQEALQYTLQGLERAKKTSVKLRFAEGYKTLSGIYIALKQFEKATEYQEKYIVLRDSLFSESGRREVERMSVKYELQQQQQKIDILQKERETEARVRQQLIALVIVGVVFTCVLLVGILYTRRLNARLYERNQDVLRQQEILEEQNDDLEMANYALIENNENLETARKRVQSLLLNIFPASIAERLERGETTIAERFESASVLFVDVSGFTRLASRISPEVLVTILDEMFSRFDALVEEFQLEKIKTIGDAYLVVGGLPTRSEDHTIRAAKMAIRVVEEVTLLASEFEMLELNVRCGLHTGPVVAGVIGKKKYAYDIWGDTVNIASRMESHGEVGKIHVSEEVYRQLQDKFTFLARGGIAVKGLGQMNTYFLEKNIDVALE
jgi:class 3 adenylate cyclase